MLKKFFLSVLVLLSSHVVYAEQGEQTQPKPESMADYCKKHTC